MTRPAILLVGGTDSSGGAGLAADIRAAAAHGVEARLAVTAVTAQTNGMVGTVAPMPPALVAEQIAFALADGRVFAVKIGMLAEAAIVAAVAEALAGFAGPIVLDPVIAASSGGMLLSEEGITGLIERLLPMTTLVTPNLPELSILASRADGRLAAGDPAPVSQTGLRGKTEAGPHSHATPRDAALVRNLFAAGAGAVLVKGGHETGTEALDVLHRRDGGPPRRFATPRLDAMLRGTGCMLATAIACRLAAGNGLETACGAAKEYVRGLLAGASAEPG
ncbi:bifunctional hydroxymethylpyrimidine kinase/phosphomethylpyrimidine kinase [Jiella mangrovi]|uniref:hydroxymethylpyrimidine kinase n=1 Tax=Jiella mangrovi TaxID=2821407 RepID=A0ABS4BBQ6_9HYPH|nr:bifunctional hydroxymethylpyrimidine kinase/phosphomethylpyrimidine kinase [Jiella mangrovi]MBP0614186.1 bifunctional hydroxymethylpyrimidine kinase/phosphomethylpyrimidine kinase [Jiella mangrovi]